MASIPLYSRMLSGGLNNFLPQVNSERELGEAFIRTATGTDSYALRFAEPLWATADVLAFGQAGGRPLLQVAFAVDGGTVRPVRTARGPAYPLRLRVVAMDESGDVVAGLDTTWGHLTERVLGASEYLMGQVAVPVPAGAVRYRVAVSQGDERGVVLPSGVARPTLPGDEFALSDLVLGGRDAGAQWRAPDGDPVRMNPFGAYASDGTLELYAEVYGAKGKGPLQLELEVTREGGGGPFGMFGGRRSTSVSGTEHPTGPVTAIRRALSLQGLPPGNYQVALRLTDVLGRRVERRRTFRILDAVATSP
jgi:hypothetical protein